MDRRGDKANGKVAIPFDSKNPHHLQVLLSITDKGLGGLSGTEELARRLHDEHGITLDRESAFSGLAMASENTARKAHTSSVDD